MLRISGGIDLVCAPEDGNDALLMGLDNSIFNVPVKLNTGGYYTVKEDTTIVMTVVGSLGYTDVSDDIDIEVDASEGFSSSVSGKMISIVIPKHTTISTLGTNLEVAVVTLSYTLAGGSTLTRDVSVIVKCDRSWLALSADVVEYSEQVAGVADVVSNVEDFIGKKDELLTFSGNTATISASGTYNVNSTHDGKTLSIVTSGMKNGDTIRIVSAISSIVRPKAVVWGERCQTYGNKMTVDYVDRNTSTMPSGWGTGSYITCDYYVEVVADVPICGCGTSFLNETSSEDINHGKYVVFSAPASLLISNGVLELEYNNGSLYLVKNTCLDTLYVYTSWTTLFSNNKIVFLGTSMGYTFSDGKFIIRTIYGKEVQYIAIKNMQTNTDAPTQQV